MTGRYSWPRPTVRPTVGSTVRSLHAARVVSLALLILLAGCSGFGPGGGDGDAMPFMNHSTAKAPPTPAGNNSTTPVDREANETLAESALLTVANQTSDGQTVTIREMNLSEGGYVAIHDARRKDAGLTHNIIGVSRYYEAGTYSTVTVKLFDVPGFNYSDDAHLMGSPRVFVTLHHETNGNTTFEYITSGKSRDGPYRTASGAVAVDFAVLTVQHETPTE